MDEPDIECGAGVQPLGVAGIQLEPERRGLAAVAKHTCPRRAGVKARWIVIGKVEGGDRPALAQGIAAELKIVEEGNGGA